MTKGQVLRIRSLEGRCVCVALRDGSRIDDCQLVSCGRAAVTSVWVYSNGFDRFVDLGDVVDLWESEPVPATSGWTRR
jgi:hypothetical protein